MTATRVCPECGAAIPDEAPAGLCPACLLRHGLGTAAYAKP